MLEPCQLFKSFKDCMLEPYQLPESPKDGIALRNIQNNILT